jgi:DNA-binding NarL/FixJ family response regulator
MPTKQRVRRTGNLPRGGDEQPALRRPIEVVIICRAELLLLGLERLLVQAPDLKVFTYSSLADAASGSASSAASRQSTHTRVMLLSDRQAEEPARQCESGLESLADEAVLLSSRPDLDLLVGCMAAGVRGFVMEGDPPPMLLAAIRSAAAGKTYVGQRTLDLLVDWLAQQERGHRGRPGQGQDLDLLRLLAEGRTTADIAQLLGVAPKTVRNRASMLYRRLGVHNRAAAVRIAEQRGLLDGRGPS